jgi:uncharacterized protein
MPEVSYQCLKCGNTQYELDEIRTTGGALSKIFDVQNKKFNSVTCTQCKYTELYKGDTNTLGNIFDFLTNG